MKKKYALEDLDCAHCAARMEEAVRKVPGVEDANVNFLALKLSVTAPDERFDEIMREVVKAAKKAVPECSIVL